jgi:4-amino-4-deoxy-L-arabinose transferase-like glycosyltransferase
VPIWIYVVLVVVGWSVLAVLVGLALGAVIRRRDQQVERWRPRRENTSESPTGSDD